MNPYLYKEVSVNWLCLVAMNRSKRSNALSIVLMGLCLVTLCLLAPHARAATKESGSGSEELLLNDIASQGEQGMNKLLHWAIEHSNPEELQQQAQNAGLGEQAESLQQRKKEFEEVMAHSKQVPNEAEIMKLSLTIAANSSEDYMTRVHALQLVQELVEDIDLANDLPGMGGLDVLIDCLLEQRDLQLQALRVIHTAAANNEKFQLKLFEKEAAIVPWLLQELYDVRSTNMCDLGQMQLEKMLIVLRAVASLSRNLPSSKTMFLQALQSDVTSACVPGQQNSNTECDKQNTFSPSLQLLFSIAETHAGCMDGHGQDKYSKGTHANIARVAIGLLSDLTVNDEAAQKMLQSSPVAGQAWQAGLLWAGLCKEVKGKGDLPERVVQLFQDMFVPVQGNGGECKNIEGGWQCVKELIQSSDDGTGLDKLKELGAGCRSMPSIGSARHQDL